MSARVNAVFDAPPALPARIGKYRVSQRIGSGAMGVVYRATDPDIQRPVALKTILPRLLAGADDDLAAVRRFRQEAQAAGRLSHPNIVSVYEYGEAPEGLYIAMECVEGRSLQALLGRGPRLAVPDVMAVMVQLLDALHCAHQQQVWHCDIKPANLLVTPDGHLKVGDFGIARLDGRQPGPHGVLLGSPGYMAPERYRGEEPDQRADLFACGVLLYELLTGVSPFSGDAATARRRVLHDEPPPPSALHGQAALAPLDAVVARALAKQPAERFASAGSMRAALIAAAPVARVPRTLSPAALGRGQAAASEPPPATRTLPPAAGDATALQQIEALLRPLFGPMARLVVRDAARRHAATAEVVAHIAAHALQGPERQAFLRRAARLAGTAATQPAAPATERPAAAATPVLGHTPLTAQDVAQAARLLAAEIGPLAQLLARRAAAGATSCEQFICRLADRAQGIEGVDCRRLLDRFWQAHRRLHPPGA